MAARSCMALRRLLPHRTKMARRRGPKCQEACLVVMARPCALCDAGPLRLAEPWARQQGRSDPNLPQASALTAPAGGPPLAR